MYVFQVVERWSRGSEVVPSLYVFECVELELTLKLAPTEEEELVESDFTCPIRLHRGQEVSPPRHTVFTFIKTSLSYVIHDHHWL